MMTVTSLKLNADEFPELVADPYHPQNAEFEQSINRIKAAAMAQQAKMTPRNVHIIKQHYAGQTNIKIAENFNVTPQTVSKTINSQAGKRLLTLLHYLADALAGPSLALRKSMLYKIAQDAIDVDRKTSIAAIAELNKMGMNEHMIESGDTGGNTINVTINQNHFPRTELDG